MVRGQHDAPPVSPLPVKPSHHVATVVSEQKEALKETLLDLSSGFIFQSPRTACLQALAAF